MLLPRAFYLYFVLILRLSGAVKSNLGHLEGASGIAGLIKTIMVLEKGVIPPNTNFERLNPKIDANFLNIKVGQIILFVELLDFNRPYSSRFPVFRGRVAGCVEHLLIHLVSEAQIRMLFLMMLTIFSAFEILLLITAPYMNLLDCRIWRTFQRTKNK